MSYTEHPVKQKIAHIVVDNYTDSPGHEIHYVGDRGVTRIEACVKSGLHADIPYVRVWKGDVCVAEFCQHNIVGIYFSEEPL